MVVCPAVAARNAVDHGVTVDDEMALLVVHGLLHLLGMDHEVDDEAERMERRERSCWPASTAVASLAGRWPLATAAALHRRPTGSSSVVVVLLLASRPLLALAETSLVRMSRAKAMALVDDGRRGARC